MAGTSSGADLAHTLIEIMDKHDGVFQVGDDFFFGGMLSNEDRFALAKAYFLACASVGRKPIFSGSLRDHLRGELEQMHIGYEKKPEERLDIRHLLR